MNVKSEEKFMYEALAEAKNAADKDEVPIGAVAVIDGTIVSRSHNVRESTQDPLGHAEIFIIEDVAKKKNSWRLDDVTIYVTVEPCLMCAGAMLQARIPRLVFGCFDKKGGAFGSLYDISMDTRLNHKIEVRSGVLAEECAKLMSEFFKRLR